LVETVYNETLFSQHSSLIVYGDSFSSGVMNVLEYSVYSVFILLFIQLFSTTIMNDFVHICTLQHANFGGCSVEIANLGATLCLSPHFKFFPFSAHLLFLPFSSRLRGIGLDWVEFNAPPDTV